MDGQPLVTAAEDGMSVLVQAGFLPDTAEYSTFIRHFPGINAHAPWGVRGTFYFEVKVYENGEQVASGRSGTTDEKGNLYLDVGEVAERCGHSVKGMFVVEYHHAKDIPIELYAFHVHKATGTYVSCNITSFIGDQLYPTAHSDQMENTLFWPGVIEGTDNETHIVVVNPYDVNMGIQAHLIGEGGGRTGTGIMQIRPRRAQVFPLDGLFPDAEGGRRSRNGRVSICVSSQYKLVAYIMFKSRTHQVISMLDHLHNFCLA
jgi:hypothetical protein